MIAANSHQVTMRREKDINTILTRASQLVEVMSRQSQLAVIGKINEITEHIDWNKLQDLQKLARRLFMVCESSRHEHAPRERKRKETFHKQH